MRLLLPHPNPKYYTPEAEAQPVVQSWYYGIRAEIQSFSLSIYKGFAHLISLLGFFAIANQVEIFTMNPHKTSL